MQIKDAPAYYEYDLRKGSMHFLHNYYTLSIKTLKLSAQSQECHILLLFTKTVSIMDVANAENRLQDVFMLG